MQPLHEWHIRYEPLTRDRKYQSGYKAGLETQHAGFYWQKLTGSVFYEMNEGTGFFGSITTFLMYFGAVLGFVLPPSLFATLPDFMIFALINIVMIKIPLIQIIYIGLRLFKGGG
jgi:hypothetical protein